MTLNPIVIKTKMTESKKIVLFSILFSIASWGWVDYGLGGERSNYEDSPVIQTVSKPILKSPQNGYNHYEHTMPTNRLGHQGNHTR